MLAPVPANKKTAVFQTARHRPRPHTTNPHAIPFPPTIFVTMAPTVAIPPRHVPGWGTSHPQPGTDPTVGRAGISPRRLAWPAAGGAPAATSPMCQNCRTGAAAPRTLPSPGTTFASLCRHCLRAHPDTPATIAKPIDRPRRPCDIANRSKTGDSAHLQSCPEQPISSYLPPLSTPDA